MSQSITLISKNDLPEAKSKALTLQGPQRQKAFKALSDSYEAVEEWDNYIWSTCELYEILKEKGNVERQHVLAENIINVCVKSRAWEKGARFLCRHLETCPGLENQKPLTFSLIAKLDVCQVECLRLLSTKKDQDLAQSNTSLGKASSSNKEQIEEAYLKVLNEPWLTGERVFPVIIACHNQCRDCKPGEGDEVEEANIEATLRFLDRLIQKKRLQVLTRAQSFQQKYVSNTGNSIKGSNSSDDKATADKQMKMTKELEKNEIREMQSLWHELVMMGKESIGLYESFRGQGHGHELSQGHIRQICSTMIEAWFYSPSIPYSEIDSAIDVILSSVDSSHVGANAAKAFSLVEKGLVFKCRPYIAVCRSHWLTVSHSMRKQTINISTIKAPSSVGPTAQDLLATIDAAITTIALLVFVCGDAFNDYRCSGEGSNGTSIPVNDLLHMTYQANGRIALLSNYLSLSLRSNLKALIACCRVFSLASVSQVQMAVDEASISLPHIFSIVRSKVGSVSTQRRAYDEEIINIKSDSISLVISAPLHFQWLVLKVLMSTRGFRAAMSLCDALLQSNPIATSWILSEQAYAQLQLEISQRMYDIMNTASRCLPLDVGLLKEMELGDESMSPIIRKFQAVLKTATLGDHVAPEIEGETRFRMGQAMWLAGGKLRKDKAGCIAYLLASAKADPQSSIVYTYIGHYYHKENSDTDRAIKCYLKALGSNPLDSEAGISLSKILLSMGDEERATRLWNDSITITSHAQWVHALRGQFYICRGEYEMSVTSFQLALELLDTDVNCWAGLGMSYYHLYQNTASQKAILKALSLAPLDTVLMNTLGEVECRLCLFHSALDRFDNVIARDPSNCLALKGAADTCLALAYQNTSWGHTCAASRNVMKGIHCIDALLKVFKDSPQGDRVKCVRKLLGDLCLFSRHLSPADFHSVHTPVSPPSSSSPFQGALLETTGLGCGILPALNSTRPSPPTSSLSNASSGNPPSMQYALLRRAEDCYRTVVSITTSEANESSNSAGDESRENAIQDRNKVIAQSWFDVGSAIYFQIVFLLKTTGHGIGMLHPSYIRHMGPEVKRLFQEAKKAFTTGIRSCPNHSGCWNGLGLCIQWEGDDFATQACFVRAIQIDSNASALANLGLFLTHRGLEDEAKICMSSLQLIESNPLTWVVLGSFFEKAAKKLTKKSTSITTNATSAGDSNMFGDGPLATQSRLSSTLIAARDSYHAALEVAKPADAILGSAITWLKLGGFLSADGLCFNRDVFSVGQARFLSRGSDQNHGDDSNNEGRLDLFMFALCGLDDFVSSELRHEVEYRLYAFLRLNPHHPLAWTLLAWCLLKRGAHTNAMQACWLGFLALDAVSTSVVNAPPSTTAAPAASSTSDDDEGDVTGARKRIKQSYLHLANLYLEICGCADVYHQFTLSKGSVTSPRLLETPPPQISVTTLQSLVPNLSSLLTSEDKALLGKTPSEMSTSQLAKLKVCVSRFENLVVTHQFSNISSVTMDALASFLNRIDTFETSNLQQDDRKTELWDMVDRLRACFAQVATCVCKRQDGQDEQDEEEGEGVQFLVKRLVNSSPLTVSIAVSCLSSNTDKLSLLNLMLTHATSISSSSSSRSSISDPIPFSLSSHLPLHNMCALLWTMKSEISTICLVDQSSTQECGHDPLTCADEALNLASAAIRARIPEHDGRDDDTAVIGNRQPLPIIAANLTSVQVTQVFTRAACVRVNLTSIAEGNHDKAAFDLKLVLKAIRLDPCNQEAWSILKRLRERV